MYEIYRVCSELASVFSASSQRRLSSRRRRPGPLAADACKRLPGARIHDKSGSYTGQANNHVRTSNRDIAAHIGVEVLFILQRSGLHGVTIASPPVASVASHDDTHFPIQPTMPGDPRRRHAAAPLTHCNSPPAAEPSVPFRDPASELKLRRPVKALSGRPSGLPATTHSCQENADAETRPEIFAATAAGRSRHPRADGERTAGPAPAACPPRPRGQPRLPLAQRRSPGSWRGPFSGPTLGSLSLASQGGQRTMTRNAAVGEGAVAGLGWQERGLPSAAARGKPRRAS